MNESLKKFLEELKQAVKLPKNYSKNFLKKT